VPNTIQALAVVVIALLPGALYVWSFEQLVGAWGVRFSDRILRFLGVTAVFHALTAPITYRLWVEFVVSGRLRSGDAPLYLWFAVIAWVFVPIALGTLIGWGTRKGLGWAKAFTGPNPAPRAWDHLFGSAPDGWIRLRLKSGRWLAGAYATMLDGSRSYAAGYPEEQDLFLVEAIEVDPESGEFLLDEEGEPVLRGSGILVRWNEVEYLDFIEA
jgi:hypothetical protein